MKTISLFSGIGGIELGLMRQGFSSEFFCEVDPLARAILRKNFPTAEIVDDILGMESLPEAELITAGFPCQDLSQAGAKRGISGKKSGLVSKLLSLIADKPETARPNWILIENVPYMLRLDRGHAMDYITAQLVALGYSWAYRVVDARAFGLPQRRQRVVLLASRVAQPEYVIFSDNYDQPDLDGKPSDVVSAKAFGFYWTEGRRGVGWVREGVPTIKCVYTLGIASPPAVWMPDKDFVGMIDIRDAERLQGFPSGWTNYADLVPDARDSFRWRLIGNAVSTRVSDWVGARLKNPIHANFDKFPLDRKKAWPTAAFGNAGGSYSVNVSQWPSDAPQEELSGFLCHDLRPLSHRATAGFLSRAEECTNIVYSNEFLDSLRRHADRMQ